MITGIFILGFLGASESKNFIMLLIKTELNFERKVLTIPVSTAISTDNPLVGPFVYIVALDGYRKITVSLNIHAMNMVSSEDSA
jgi:NADH:ubiquinone oxidoreductase subunit K